MDRNATIERYFELRHKKDLTPTEEFELVTLWHDLNCVYGINTERIKEEKKNEKG